MKRRSLLVGLTGAAFTAACGGSTTKSTPSSQAAPSSVAAGAGSLRTATPTALRTPAATSSAVAQRGGTLKVAWPNSPTSLDPAVSKASTDAHVYRLLYNTLVAVQPDVSVTPELAQSWENPDPLTWLFHLRSGVKFQDDTDFNAAAVKTNIDRIKDPATKASAAADLAPVDHVEVLDANTVKFSLQSPYPALPISLYLRGGMMVSPAAMQKFGADLATNPVGTGPFKLADFKSDDHTTVTRFDKYWQPELPYLDQITLQVIADPTAALTSLTAGGVDVAWGLQSSQYPDLKSNKSLKLVELADINEGKFTLNTTKPPFNNKALRQAMAWALGPEDVIKLANRGVGDVPIQGIAPTWAWWFDPNGLKFSKDPAQAKQFLGQAGMPNGFTFKVMYFGDQEPVLDVMRANLQAVGITMQNDKVDVATYATRNRGDTLDYQAGWSIAGIQGLLDPSLYVRKFLWSKASFAAGGYSNPQVDQLMLDGEATADQAKRKPIYQQINQIFGQDYVQVRVFSVPAFAGLKPAVQGVVVHPEEVLHVRDAWLQH